MSTKAGRPRAHKTKSFAQMKKERGYKKPTWKQTDLQRDLEIAQKVLASRGKGGKQKTFAEYKARDERGKSRAALGKLTTLNVKIGDEFSSSIPGDAAQSFFGSTGGIGSPYASPSSSPRSGPTLVRTITPIDWSLNPKTRAGAKGAQGGKTAATTRSQARAKSVITIPDSEDEGPVKPPPGGGGGGKKPPPGGGKGPGPPSAPKKPRKKKKEKPHEEDEKAAPAKPAVSKHQQKAAAIRQFAQSFTEDQVNHLLDNKPDLDRIIKQGKMDKREASRLKNELRSRQATFKLKPAKKPPAKQSEIAAVQKFANKFSDGQVALLLSSSDDFAKLVAAQNMSDTQAQILTQAFLSRPTGKAPIAKAVMTEAEAQKTVAGYDLDTIDRYLSNKGWADLVKATGLSKPDQKVMNRVLRRNQSKLVQANLKDAEHAVKGMSPEQVAHYTTRTGWSELVQQLKLDPYAQHVIKPMIRKRNLKLRRAGLKARKKAGKKQVQIQKLADIQAQKLAAIQAQKLRVQAFKAGKQKQKARVAAHTQAGKGQGAPAVAVRLARANQRHQTNLELHRVRKEQQAAYRKKKAQSRQGIQISAKLDVAKLQIRQTGPKSYSVRSTGMSPQVQKHIQHLLDRLSGKLYVNQKLMSKKSAYTLIVRLLTERKTVSVQIQ